MPADADHVRSATPSVDDLAQWTSELEAELFGIGRTAPTEPEHHDTPAPPEPPAAVSRAEPAAVETSRPALGLRARASAAGQPADRPAARPFAATEFDEEDARLLAARLAPASGFGPAGTDGETGRSYESWAASDPVVHRPTASRPLLLLGVAIVIAAAGGGIGMLLLPSGSDAPVAAVEAAAEKTVDTVVEAALRPAEASGVAAAAADTVAAKTDAETPVSPAANAVETVPVVARPVAVTSAADPAAVPGPTPNATAPEVGGSSTVAAAAPAAEAPDSSEEVADVVADRWEVADAAEPPADIAPFETADTRPAAPDVMGYAPAIPPTPAPLPADQGRSLRSAADRAEEARQAPAEEPAVAAAPAEPKVEEKPAETAAADSGGNFAIATVGKLVTTEPASTGSTTAAGSTAVVNSDVNMRAAPTNGGAVLGVIPSGREVAVISCDQWCKVSYDGREGWVFRRFVQGATATN